MSSNPQNVWILLGATVFGLVSAVGLALFEKLRQEKEKQAMKQDIKNLDSELQTMRQELAKLRDLPKSSSKKRRRSKGSSSSTASTDSFVSATDMDSSDLEFYDVTDDEEGGGNSTAVNNVNGIPDQIDSMLDNGNTENLKIILEQLQDLYEEFPEDINIVWRMAKAYYKLALLSNNPRDKQEYINLGVEICESAFKKFPDACDIHKWYAILVGTRADIQPMKERISDGHLFKKHVDKALALNPQDYNLHFMLGRFAYEVANLKWYERTAASALFGEPPSATFEEALNCFLEVEKYCQYEWKENKFFIAKCHIAIGQNSEALKWLRNAKAVTSTNDIDKKIQDEITNLLKKYEN